MIEILKYLLMLESPKMRRLQRLLSNPLCLRKVKEVEKKKVLGSDEIDSQRISFCLVKGDREDIIKENSYSTSNRGGSPNIQRSYDF